MNHFSFIISRNYFLSSDQDKIQLKRRDSYFAILYDEYALIQDSVTFIVKLYSIELLHMNRHVERRLVKQDQNI